MWFVLISTFGIVILNSSPCFGMLNPPEFWPTALIHHPQLTLDYAMRTQTHHDRKHFEEFANLSKEERKKACRNYLVDAISFSIPPDKTDYIEDDFENLVEETFATLENPYIEDLRYETVEGERRAAAHICIERDEHDQSWAISTGHHEGVSIVYRKPVGSIEFHLFGLLEEMPNFDPRLTQRQLNILYATGRTDAHNSDLTDALNPDKIDSDLNHQSGQDLLRNLAKRQSTRSLCSLNEFERFRVCAVGYLAWKHSKIEFPNYSEGNYVSQSVPRGRSRCIQGKITLDFGIPNDSSTLLPTDSQQRVQDKPFFVEADILPCSINMKAKCVGFFLTNDPFTSDSMFSLEAHWKETSRRPREYHLIAEEINAFEVELHMSNVRVLKP